MSKVMEIKKLGKSCTINGSKRILLENMDLTIEKGQFICIIGSSGCGKTTFLELLAGFQQPDTGIIFHDNIKVSKPETSRIMIFQDFNQLFPWKTLYENIMFPLKNVRKNLSDGKMKEIVENTLEMVSLRDYGSYYPHQLSGGMKQKSAIARALALKPEVLLMDEPFGSLDAQIRSQLQRLLLDVWKKTGVTIIFVTHDIQEAILLSDRIVMMDKNPGRIKVVINNDIQRPRNIMDKDFIALYGKLLNLLDNGPF